MQIIEKYFPNLNENQKSQFATLDELYKDWNSKINVISRKDIDNLYTHHILHSLGIAKIIQFTPESAIMDVGTGGGFPGIPLAILFPECKFHLLDRIRKKQQNAMPNGLICLKGGELQNEVAPFKKISIVYNLKEYFKEEYFDTKKVVYVPVHK